MVYQRVILSVKRTNSESKGKRLEVGWEARGLSLKIFPRTPAAFSFSWAGEEWLAVRQKHQNRKHGSWMKLKEVIGGKFQPHVRFVLEITSKMTRVFRSANASTNLKRRRPTSAVIYLLDPIKDIQNHYMHRQFQSACKRHILNMHLPACPLPPSPHFLRPLHVLPG